MTVVATPEAVSEALGNMRRMLRADGYDLEIGVEAGVVGLTVVATPEACEECLVPKQLFTTMVVDALSSGGVAVHSADLRVTYPLDAAH